MPDDNQEVKHNKTALADNFLIHGLLISQDFETSNGADLDSGCTNDYLNEAEFVGLAKVLELRDYIESVNCDAQLTAATVTTTFASQGSEVIIS